MMLNKIAPSSEVEVTSGANVRVRLKRLHIESVLRAAGLLQMIREEERSDTVGQWDFPAAIPSPSSMSMCVFGGGCVVVHTS